MNQDTYEFEVRFDLYCPICKDWTTPQEKDPCHGCLTQPYNLFSMKPVCWKLRDGETDPSQTSR